MKDTIRLFKHIGQYFGSIYSHCNGLAKPPATILDKVFGICGCYGEDCIIVVYPFPFVMFQSEVEMFEIKSLERIFSSFVCALPNFVFHIRTSQNNFGIAVFANKRNVRGKEDAFHLNYVKLLAGQNIAELIFHCLIDKSFYMIALSAQHSFDCRKQLDVQIDKNGLKPRLFQIILRHSLNIARVFLRVERHNLDLVSSIQQSGCQRVHSHCPSVRCRKWRLITNLQYSHYLVLFSSFS